MRTPLRAGMIADATLSGARGAIRRMPRDMRTARGTLARVTRVNGASIAPPSPGSDLFRAEIHPDVRGAFPVLDRERRETLDLVLASIRGELGNRKKFDPVAADREAALPDGILAKLGKMGLMGLLVPEEHGGFAFNTMQWVETMALIAGIDLSIAVTLGAHQGIGYKALLLAGTPEQKARWLPRLATGEVKAAYALTEAGAGSDVLNIKSTAVPDSDHYILNGEKIFISNGGFADFFTVFARVPGSGRQHGEIKAFIVTRDMQGVETGPPEHKFGIRASSTTSVTLTNVRVPAENVIEDKENRLYGMRLVMEILNQGRLSLGAGALGVQRVLLAKAEEYAAQRQQFGKPIAEFPLIQEKIARMRSGLYALESMVYLTAGLIDRGVLKRYPVEAAICKVFGSELAEQSARELMQIMGGMGYMVDAEAERLYRDIRIAAIFEGTNEINLMQIAGKGLEAPATEIQGALKAVRKGVMRARQSLPALWAALSRPLRYPHLGVMPAELEPLAKTFEELTARFGRSVDMALVKHGKILGNPKTAYKEELRLQALARTAIDLYGMLAVLLRTRDTFNGVPGVGPRNSAEQRLTLARHFFAEAAQRMEQNLLAVANGGRADLVAAAAARSQTT